jgi:DNA invertase Pin-like site-specific DNA recombinase
MKAFPLFRAVRRVQGRRAAGLFEIFEAQALGGCRSRPILARLIDLLRPGDALIVIR